MNQPLTEVDEAPVPQRVGRPGRDLRHVDRAVGRRAPRRDRAHRADDEVDGDDVDDALGHAGELPQQAAGERDDHRLGHAEAADPARPRLGERRLDDRRAARSTPGRRRATRPARVRRAPSCTRTRRASRATTARARPGFDHAVLDPLRAPLLGLLGEQRHAGRAELASRLGAEARERLGRAAVGLRVGAGPAGGVDLAAPVDVEEERALGQQLLGRRARGGCRRRSTSRRRRGAGARRATASVCAMRVGPRRLTSTAESSGESNATVAALWMTMSHDGERGAPGVVEVEPVAADIARR